MPANAVFLIVFLYARRRNYSAFSKCDLAAVFIGSLILGIGITLYKIWKGELQKPNKTDMKRAACLALIYGIFIALVILKIPRDFNFRIQGALIIAPLAEEFIFRVLFPYVFLQGLAIVPFLVKKKVCGKPVPYVLSHFFAALFFAYAHHHNDPFGPYEVLYYSLFGFFVFSGIFSELLDYKDATTAYIGVVVMHGLLNLGKLIEPI